MSRSWTGYLAGAAFALSAAAVGGVAWAQGPAADAQRDAQHDAQHDGVRIERHIVQGDGGPERHIERRMIIRDGAEGGHHMNSAEHLRTMLQLKPGQEAALTAYLAAVKPNLRAEHIIEMSDHADKTTTQRLAEMETHMAEQAAQAHARIEATRKFYNQLEPSQKKVFDQMPMMMLGPMGPMMPMGNMKVMVNMNGMHGMHGMHGMPPLPPVPPIAPIPPAPRHD